MSKSKRKAIPKSVRFEVLKRDKFTCQYCGEEAPKVVLQIDHIRPVADGGGNEIANLVTSCQDCNSGKSDRLLSDDSAITKAKRQMDILQDRREQLEMLMEWHRGLKDEKTAMLESVIGYWVELAPGFGPNESGIKMAKSWLRKFTFAEVLSAMDIAADRYIEIGPDGCASSESWELAWNKISGICHISREKQKDPEIADIYYIRGILRNRLKNYYDNGKAISLLLEARRSGASLIALKDIVLGAASWSAFTAAINDLIDELST